MKFQQHGCNYQILINVNVHLFQNSDNLVLVGICLQVTSILIRFWPVEVSIVPVLRLISQRFILFLCQCIEVLLFLKTGDIDENIVNHMD